MTMNKLIYSARPELVEGNERFYTAIFTHIRTFRQAQRERGFLILIILLFIPTSAIPFWQSFFPEQNIQPQKPAHKPTVILVPFGNNTLQGRSLKSNFESSIAHHFVRELQQELEKQFPEARIKISHEKTDILQPMQLATMSNCLSADLVLQFQFYLDHEPKLYLYQSSYSNDFLSKCWDLSWCHADEAYLINKKSTTLWREKMAETLSNPDYARWFFTIKPHPIPLKPLTGIIAPALLIEIGLANDDDWKQFIAPLTESLKPIIQEISTAIKQDNE